jgi:hypothetical protein
MFPPSSFSPSPSSFLPPRPSSYSASALVAFLLSPSLLSYLLHLLCPPLPNLLQKDVLFVPSASFCFFARGGYFFVGTQHYTDLSLGEGSGQRSYCRYASFLSLLPPRLPPLSLLDFPPLLTPFLPLPLSLLPSLFPSSPSSLIPIRTLGR